jgi:hypothetical protein
VSEQCRGDQPFLRKKRAILALLLIVAVWPLLHRALVAHFDVNPWKLGGFAMYASATPPLKVTVFHGVTEGVVALDERLLPPSVQEQLDRFRIERHALGRLRSADGLGQTILAALPEIDWIVISIQRMTLDPKTARMISSRTRYRYPRDPSL